MILKQGEGEAQRYRMDAVGQQVRSVESMASVRELRVFLLFFLRAGAKLDVVVNGRASVHGLGVSWHLHSLPR